MPREAPPTDTIYTGMLAVTLGAVLVGCVLLALELNNDYDWATTATAAPPAVPAKGSGPVAVGGQIGRVMPQLRAGANAQSELPPVVTTPATIPAPITLPNPILAVAPPQTDPAPASKSVETSLPVAAPPVSKPTGITPSPLKLPGDRR